MSSRQKNSSSVLFPFQFIQVLNQYKIHLTDSPETSPPGSVKTSKKDKIKWGWCELDQVWLCKHLCLSYPSEALQKSRQNLRARCFGIVYTLGTLFYFLKMD